MSWPQFVGLHMAAGASKTEGLSLKPRAPEQVLNV